MQVVSMVLPTRADHRRLALILQVFFVFFLKLLHPSVQWSLIQRADNRRDRRF